MSIQAPASNSKEVENVSKRVQNTKKEIEQLKAELEKLINSGVHSSKTAPQVAPEKSEPTQQTSAPFKKSAPKMQSKKETPPKKENSPKKTRNYNVEETREYIKKQREKRAEQLKAQINVTDNRLDLKKQRLKELHQKTIELVTKNVQLKRERSKSRDRAVPLRLDKAPVGKAPQNNLKTARTLSQDRLCPKAKTDNLRAKSQENLSKGQPRSPLKNETPPKNRTGLETKQVLNRGRPHTRKIPDLPASNKSRDKPSPVPPPGVDSIDTNLLYPSNLKLKTNQVGVLDKTSLPPFEEIVDENNETIGLNKRVTNIQSTPLEPDCIFDKTSLHLSGPSQKSRDRNKPIPVLPPGVDSVNTNFLYPCNLKVKTDQVGVLGKTALPPFEEIVEENNETIGLNKSIAHIQNSLLERDVCVKETQTSKGAIWGEPHLLEPPPALPYPYNFINTVKRKLQCAINSPRTADVGVQNSERTPEKEKTKSKQEIKELLIRSAASEVKSFVSHKGPNLDLGPVENLELVPPNKRISKNLFFDYDSDSDTSKNIPEISSESLILSQKNGQLDPEPKLSLDRLKDLKLHPLTRTKSKSSSLVTDNGYPENDSYTSDFLKETAEKSTKSKSGSDSIKTIASEKQTRSNRSFETVTNESSTIKTMASERKEPSEIIILSFNMSENPKNNENSTSKTNEETIKSLVTDGQISKSVSDSVFSNSPSFKKNELSLKEPTVSLNFKKQENVDLEQSRMRNITIRQPAVSTNNNVNEIHLKFEAEVRLLNDFNQSLKQFKTVEKAFENLKNNKETSVAMTKILQNVDTQTSVITKTSTNVTTSAEKSNSDNNNRNSINVTRGSDILDETNDLFLSNNKSRSMQNSTVSSQWNLSILNTSNNTNISTDCEDNRSKFSISNVENYNVKNCAGLSLNMFEQLIKDEDARINHLKAIIKIREQALLDRTKGELVWLEIQKKQLIETGKIEEASLLKKKQRGIILKHEQERNEIKKLKQMQKAASEERKNILKQQRNLIKSKLSTEKMLSKIKVQSARERRSSGPLRVVQSETETSISVRSSALEDVSSVELEAFSDFSGDRGKVPVSNVKRSLLMREVALQKRRKTAEELLRWHRKLLDEEQKIAELEAAATSVADHNFTGKQLNQLWKKMTGRDERKFHQDKLYVMSQAALEGLCKCARQQQSSTNKNRKIAKYSDASSASDTSRKNSEPYSYIFEPESVQEIINSQEEKTISSISQLIDNFSKIEDEIRKSPLIEVSSQTNMTPNHVSEPEKSAIVDEEESEKTEDAPSAIETISEKVPTIEETPRRISPEDEEIKTPRLPEKEMNRTNLNLEEAPNESSVPEEIKISISEAEAKPPSDEIQATTYSPPHLTEDTKTSSVLEETKQEASTSDLVPEEIKSPSVLEETKQEASTSDLVPEEIKSPSVLEETRQDVSISNLEEAAPSVITPSVSEEHKRQSISKEETNRPNATSHSVSEEVKTASLLEQDLEEETPVPEEIKTLNVLEKDTRQPNDEKNEEEESTSEIKTTRSLLEDKRQPSNEKQASTSELEEQAPSDTSSSVPEEIKTSLLEEDTRQTSDEKQIITSELGEEKAPSDSSCVSEEIKTPTVLVEDARQPIDEKTEEEEIKTATVLEEKEPEEECSKDLSLEEALESAFKIEESLSRLNQQLNREEVLETASKIEESLNQLEKLTSDKSEDVSTLNEVRSLDESCQSSENSEKTPQKKIDVKKRVSEILADANAHKNDKSPRVQDLYVTAYDVGPANSEFIEPFEEGRQLPTNIFGSEAEELWRKQLAIEQEIKQLEQQQKEQLSYVFMREIPNKPPPPYTPPSSTSLPLSIVPSSVKEVNEISAYSSKVLHKAYYNGNLDKVKFSENGFKLFSKVEVAVSCAEFVFNICRDVAREFYKQLEQVEEPSWLVMGKKPQLTKTLPPDAAGLDKILNRKLREIFGFGKVHVQESAIVKWGRKKRDHVDEILVVESQEEESQWTTFDWDELVVKDQVTSDIMKMLIGETASVFCQILAKKKVALS